jgi:hypothetical protein
MADLRPPTHDEVDSPSTSDSLGDKRPLAAPERPTTTSAAHSTDALRDSLGVDAVILQQARDALVTEQAQQQSAGVDVRLAAGLDDDGGRIVAAPKPPACATGCISIWPPPASATRIRKTSSMWIGGVGVAMWSPTQPTCQRSPLPVGRRPRSRHPPGQVPAVLLERLQPHQRQRPPGPIQLPAATDGSGDRYAQVALAEELARVAAAPVGQRNRQLWESTRNLYNLVARTLASGRQISLQHPPLSTPERVEASPAPPSRAAGEAAKERG